VSLKDQLKSVQQQTGKVPKELEGLVELPQSCWEAWKWFIKLHSRRSSSGFSVNPLQYSEMLAYFKIQGVQPEEWEVRLIEKWDDVVLKHYQDQSEAQSKKAKQQTKRK